MARKTSWVVGGLAMLLAGLIPPGMSLADVAAGLVEQVDLADPRAEHAFAFGGDVTRDIAGEAVGGHDVRRPAAIVRGKQSWVSWQVRVQPGVPITLEFEEIHGRSAETIGYLVLIDERPVYLRTWQGAGAGPVHYFVQLPPSDRCRLTIRLVNLTDAPFAISRLWVFGDFERYFDQADMAVDFHLAPTVRLGFQDLKADAAAVARIADSLGDHPHARPAWTTWIGYAQISDDEIVRQIDHVLEVARETQLPVHLSFDTWWAQTPSGHDGRGGRWSDIEYQQVVFNQTTGQYQLSVPNQWASTPWLTVNHPELNAFKARRLAFAAGHLRRRYRELSAEGQRHLLLALNLDNEPVYWASGNAGLGSELLLADFNPAAVEAAARQGVTLDPADGLSRDERLWLFGNLLDYNQLIAAALGDALGRDAIQVDPSGVRPARDLLRHNIYTQAMTASAAIQYPMLHPAYPLWETAAPAAARVGGEWNADSIRVREAATHHVALGRSAVTNAECGNNVENMRGVRPAYALGQRFYALYNYPLDRMDHAASELADIAAPYPAPIYLPVLSEGRVADEAWQDRLFASRDVQTGVIGNTAVTAVFPRSAEAPGVLTWRLEAPDGEFQGLYAEISGRAFVHRVRDPRVHVRVLAGPEDDAEAMVEAGRFFDSGDLDVIYRFDFGPAAAGRGHIFVRIEMHAPDLPADVLSWCSVYHVRFTVPWPRPMLEGLPPQDESLGTLRKQNLLVSWRRDAELAIESLAERAPDAPQWNQSAAGPAEKLAAAQQACTRGAYAEAYRLANEGLCQLLPATFEVRQSGWLEPYAMHVSAQVPLTARVKEWGPRAMRFELAATEAAEVRIRVAGLAAGAAYELQKQEGGWVVRPVPQGEGALLADRQGRIEWAASVAAGPPQLLERVVHGMFVRVERNGVMFIFRDDAGGGQRIRIDKQTIIRRGPAGAEGEPAVLRDLRFGDRISVRLGESATAAEVTADYRMVQGTVGEFRPATPFSMPSISVQGSDDVRVIDLWATLHLPEGPLNLRANPLRAIDLRAGHPVGLRTHPRTARVFELWVGDAADGGEE